MSTDLPRTFGGYSLVKLLAKGGMGEIYLARRSGVSHFEKFYALKKLLGKFTHDVDVSGRFIDEARLGARLQHPNIVQVFDLGEVGGEYYMTTEFVDGFDLRRVLRFCHEKKKRIPLDVALFMVREVLSGLAYAHRQVDATGRSINLIHRDISPQNVLVSFEGEVKIIDFGLAKSTQSTQETQANVVLGNFGYMSPEQARGKRLDVRADVYSTGVVLFELVTATKRFLDENPMRLLEMVARPTPMLPSDRCEQIPKAIDRIYATATAVNPDERYQSAEAFRDEVTEALHRLNPRASREHLAQFLSYLFLGGEPLPTVDDDILNHSVAIQVQELVGNIGAFQRNPKEENGDRTLSAFSDDMPQTDSHDLMRGAREGEGLSHEELTGRKLAVASGVSMAFAEPLGPPGDAAEMVLAKDEDGSPRSVSVPEVPTWPPQPVATDDARTTGPFPSPLEEKTQVVAASVQTAPESTKNSEKQPLFSERDPHDSWSIDVHSQLEDPQELTQPGASPEPLRPQTLAPGMPQTAGAPQMGQHVRAPAPSHGAAGIRPAAQPRGRPAALSGGPAAPNRPRPRLANEPNETTKR